MLRSKSFASSLGGLPDIRVRIVGADDGQKAVTLAGLPGLLSSDDWSKPRIVM